MATISLTLPVSGTVITAGLHSTNYTTIQNAINGGLDNNNFASGKIFDPSKLMQNSAVDGDGLAWDNAAAIWKRTTDKALRVGAIAAGSTGQVITTTGGVAVWGSTGAYDRSTAGVDVQNSSTETSIYTKAIAGNDMSTNKMLRLTLLGDFLHNNVAADTLTFKVKFGGTTFYAQATNFGNVVGTARHPWRLVLHVSNLGATNSQMILGSLGPVESADRTAPTTGIGQAMNQPSGAFSSLTDAPLLGISTLGTIDTTTSQTLDITVQWSAANANNSWRLRYGVLELV